MKRLLFMLLACLPFLAASTNHFSTIPAAQPASGGLALTNTAPGTILADWTQTNPPALYTYTVAVVDLTSRQLVTTFQTTNLSATVGNLASGHLYRFTVDNGAGSIINEDISGW